MQLLNHLKWTKESSGRLAQARISQGATGLTAFLFEKLLWVKLSTDILGQQLKCSIKEIKKNSI